MITAGQFSINALIRELKKDYIKNISIIEFISDNPVLAVYHEGDSLLVKGLSDQVWIYISSSDESELKFLLKKLVEDDVHFAFIEDWMIPIVSASKEIDWKMSALRYYLPINIETPQNKIPISRLLPSDAEFIIENSNYKQFLSIDYITERIKKSFSAGIYEDGKLIACGLTHDDGALGTLHVIDERRRKGYATEITISLIRQCRENGKIPCAQIVEENLPAINMVNKLGFVKDRRVTWLKLNQHSKRD